MSQIIWNDSFSVNNDEIDVQHQRLIQIYNKIDMKICTLNTKLSDRLEKLKAMEDYARDHFSFEEKYMREIDYPKLVEHHRIHKNFNNLIYTYYRKLLDGDYVFHYEIVSVLKEWLLDHILKEDKQYALFHEAKKLS